jgi:hypothetical protein
MIYLRMSLYSTIVLYSYDLDIEFKIISLSKNDVILEFGIIYFNVIITATALVEG